MLLHLGAMLGHLGAIDGTKIRKNDIKMKSEFYVNFNYFFIDFRAQEGAGLEEGDEAGDRGVVP